LCLKGNLLDKIIWSIASVAPISVMGSVFILLYSLITGFSIEQLANESVMSLIMVAILTRTSWLFCYFIMLKNRFREMNLKKAEWRIIILLFSITILLMCEFMKLDFNMQVSGIEQISLLFVEVLLVVILGCCVTLCIKINTINTKLSEKEKLLTMQENQKEMFEQVYKAQEETRIIRHDMKHFINIWLRQLKEGNIADVENSMESFENQVFLADTTVYYIKDNDVINYVLYNKLKICKANNIEYNVEVTTSFAKNMEMDISVIISNLMDNAIESSIKQPLGERYISIQMFKRLAINNIIISNKISKSVLQANPKLITTNVDKTRHGYGIKSVKKLVEKYNGDIDIVEENNYFIVHILGI
jgi:two-component system sensor histidine kinase AgrC